MVQGVGREQTGVPFGRGDTDIEKGCRQNALADYCCATSDVLSVDFSW
jgi:hypothetical protein